MLQLKSAMDLLPRHKSFLLDAYGVLVTSAGALPGARVWIDRLNHEKIPYFVVTNDASRLPETAAAFYASCGLAIPAERVITAGLTIGPALGSSRLRCIVLGTADTCAYAERAGHEVLDLRTVETADCDAVIVGDDSGFDLLKTMNAVLTCVHRQVLAGRRPRLLLANSDLIYPRSNHAYGFTSGAIAVLLEAALKQLHPNDELRFEVMGKPSVSFFRTALSISGFAAGETVMIGDQLHTDIAGASASGLASALIVADPTSLPRELSLDRRPTYLLRSLE